MGTLYDALRASKSQRFPDYWTLLWGRKLSDKLIKTLTGTLPLTFTTSETKLRSWTIYGADIEHEKTATGKSIGFYTDEDKLRDWTIYGNNEVGKNIVDLSTYSVAAGDINNIMISGETGTIVFDKTGSGQYGGLRWDNIPFEDGKQYTISFVNNTANSTGGRVTLRRNDTNAAVMSSRIDLNTPGDKSVTITYDAASAPTGVYLSVTANWSLTGEDSVNISGFMLRPADTSADFEPYQQGVGQRSPNLYTFADDDKTDADVEFVADSATGTITATGRSSSTSGSFISLLSTVTFEAGTYEFTGDAGASLTTYYSYVREAGSSTTIAGDREGQNRQFTLSAPTQLRIYFRVAASNPDTVHIFRPMICKVGETPTSFIPYGYIVPVQSGGVTTNVFIGSDPLIADESVSKTSTGVDIATTDGNNTITTSLYNQPDMSISYNEFTGVGMFIGGVFMISLKLVAGGQTLYVLNIQLNKPLRAGETLTSKQTGKTIQTIAGVENRLSPAPKVASYGGSFDMKIKYKE